MDIWIERQTDGWMDGWMDGRMDGYLNGQTDTHWKTYSCKTYSETLYNKVH